MARKKLLYKSKKIKKEKIKPEIIETKPAEPITLCPRCKKPMSLIKEVSNETIFECFNCKYKLAIC